MPQERKKKQFSVRVYDQKHLRNLSKRLRKVQALIDEAARKGAAIGARTGYKDIEKDFRFDDFPQARREIDALLRELSTALTMNVEEADSEAWGMANAKNDAMVDAMLASTGVDMARKTTQPWYNKNARALGAFQKRVKDGMNLSTDVWNLGQFKGELELALEMGLGRGKSAAELSRDVRSYLKYPDKLFRRVRDEKGVLRLSKAAREFHPGRGVYRSSYKNALRVTATETNMAYRTADSKRWQQIPFVLGIKIQVSKTNHPVTDICDELAGDYPKDFVFTGWHPFCKCFATSILPAPEKFLEYQQAILDGKDVSDWQWDGEVKDVPGEFNKWVKDNEERIAKAKSLPYFLKDNEKYIDLMSTEQRDAIEKLSFKNNSRSEIDAISAEYDAIINSDYRKGMLFDEYTSGSKEINDVARFGKLLEHSYNSNDVDDWKDLISRLDSTIEGLPRLQKNVDLFRSSRTLGDLPISNLSVSELNKLIGQTFTDKGFSSFTFSHEYAKKLAGDNYVIVLKGKKGLKGVSLANTSSYNTIERQEEYLLARGSKFRVLGAKEVGGAKHVFVEVVKDDMIDARLSQFQNAEIIGTSSLREKAKNRLAGRIGQVAKKSEIFKDGLTVSYKDFQNGTLMAWDDGKLVISTTKFKLESGEVFCPAEHLYSAIRKLRSGKTLTFSEEYAVECLFHESVHARALKTFEIVKGTIDEKIAEACTQLYARDRYVRIMKAYGVEAKNYERIKFNGLGYSRECDVLRRFFEKEGKLQLGELINIANETESGKAKLLKKIMGFGLSKDDALKVIVTLLK